PLGPRVPRLLPVRRRAGTCVSAHAPRRPPGAGAPASVLLSLPESTMLKSTVILAIQHLRTTPESAGTGRHRGDRATERLGFLNLPGHGRHRRELAIGLRADAAPC
ncbi:hypothetical protein, partial [Streptomyces sp. NPDC096153]|uniref:hypothetical protein n=1 Tax=Streptomyces sp. NPDC096153 TaxID=3155548 RepID=UPI003328A1ED